MRMLTAEKPREMPSSTTCSRWPSGSIASTNGLLTSTRRPLDLSIRSTSSVTCAGGEDRVGELVAAGAGDEDPARVVDPHLLDGRVVEVALQRTEAGDPGDELLDDTVTVVDGCDRTGEARGVVVGDQRLRRTTDQGHVALRVDALTAHRVTQARVERLDQLAVGGGVGQAHPGSPRRPQESCGESYPTPSRRETSASPDLWTNRTAQACARIVPGDLVGRPASGPEVWEPGQRATLWLPGFSEPIA